MSKRLQAASHPMLVQFASGVVLDVRDDIADFLAPVVPVPATIGQFKAYNTKDAFVVYNTARAVGGPAVRMEFGKTDGTFNCKPNALEAPIDDAVIDAAGELAPQEMEDSVNSLLNGARRSRAIKVVSDLMAAIPATANVGKWASDPAVDPIAELDAQILAIAIAAGMMPNAIAIGLTAWSIAKNHPKVVARFKGISGGVSADMFKSVLLNPEIDFRVSEMAYDQAKLGASANNAIAMGSEVFVFIRSEKPDRYDPSMAKTFRGGRYGIEDVRTYYEDRCRSNVIAVDWSEDTQVVGSLCGRRLTIS